MLHNASLNILLTIWCMKILVSVRNCVTTKAIRPGIAVSGTRKLMNDTTTIAIHGKKY